MEATLPPPGDSARVEVALVPPDSPFAEVARRAAVEAGASFVKAELASPADVIGRVLVVDLTRVVSAQRLGRGVIAIGHDPHLACYDVVRPEEVEERLPRALRNLVEAERLRGRVRQDRDVVRTLNEIGFALSAITDTEELLDRLLTHARRALRADGGTIYLLREGALVYAACQNDSVPFQPVQPTLPLNASSLAGFVALYGTPLRLHDEATRLPPGLPYAADATNDRAMGYRTRSALLVPLRDRDEQVFGVLGLYNAKPVPGLPLLDFSKVLPFSEADLDLARSIASQAAVALESHRLVRDIRQLFDGFVTAAVSVIEARDPSTAGHSQRVAQLTTRLARACTEAGGPHFEAVRFTEAELEELHYASILHDFGKVGVPEAVLLKADKLHPWELEGLEFRFRIAALQTRLEVRRQHLGEGELAARLAMLDEDLALVRRLNRAGSRYSEADLKRLQAVAARWWLDDGEEPVLGRRELGRLCIPRGSLDPEERRAIELHVTHTYNFLKVIPWTRQLARVPELAHAHHEKLDGSGYPRGLTREGIPFGARLMAVADIFDALTAGDRPYKAGMSVTAAARILRMEAEAGHIEAEVVELFIRQRLWEGVVLASLG